MPGNQTNSDQYRQAAILLAHIEAALKKLNRWSNTRPDDQALASDEPFGVDRLDFPQWLQFVFIEKLQGLMERREPLPLQCGTAPMAEEYFRDSDVDARELIGHLERIDNLFSHSLK